MFKKAIREAMKRQGRTGRWAANKAGIKLPSFWAGMMEGHNFSVEVTEKLFKALGITLNIPEE